MEELAPAALPEGMAGEWTGVSLEQKESGGQTIIIFALGLVFVFLVLAAQYESFVLPFVIILSVPLAILGALGLQGAARPAQRRVLPGGPGDAGGPGEQERHPHRGVRRAAARAGRKSPLEAVIEAAAVRLRPILMTSIAFLLGVVPLMLASGAGAGARNSLGTTVFGGMLVSTVVNLVFIPTLYVAVQRLRRASPHAAHEPGGPGPRPAPHPEPGV